MAVITTTMFQSGNTATLSLAGNNAAVSNVAMGTYPPEGSRVLTAQYNWNTAGAYSEDLQALVARGIESTIQGVFIDNSQCSFPVQFYIPGTMHNFIVPAYQQATMPALFGTAMAFQLSIPPAAVASGAPIVTGLGVPAQYTRIIFVNVPTQPCVWPVAFPVDGGQLLATGNANFGPKAGPGRVAIVTVQVAVAVGTIAIVDGFSVTAANTLLVIPTGATVGTIYTLNAPFYSALQAIFQGGATGTISIVYS